MTNRFFSFRYLFVSRLFLLLTCVANWLYAQNLEITTSVLPVGTVRVDYDVQLEATGGVEPYRWSLPGEVTVTGHVNIGFPN
jgi:hypothetical protein